MTCLAVTCKMRLIKIEGFMLRGGGDITGNDCSNFVALIKRRCSRDFCLFIFGNINYGSVLT